MDYLRSFTIGTSGLVPFSNLATHALLDKDKYTYSFETYSLLVPIFYGLWAMFATYLKKTYKLSLGQSLFITSILAFTLVNVMNFVMHKGGWTLYKKTPKEWMKYILENATRYLVNFNLIIYFLEKYFSLYAVKIFVIGSSIFSYFLVFLKVMWLDWMGKTNYDYRLFAVTEAINHGISLLAVIYLFNKVFGYDLKTSFIIWAILVPVAWVIFAYNWPLYDYTTKEWIIAFVRVLLTFFAKGIVLYYLVKNL